MLEMLAAAAVQAFVGALTGYLMKAVVFAAPLIVAGLIAAALHWHPHRRAA